MNLIDKAQRVLDTARARHAGIVTPGWVSSPADTCGTVTLPAAFIASCEPGAGPAAAEPVEATAVRV